MHLDKEIINLKEIILKLDETYGKPGSSLKRELWSSFNALNEAINSKSSCTEVCECEIRTLPDGNINLKMCKKCVNEM